MLRRKAKGFSSQRRSNHRSDELKDPHGLRRGGSVVFSVVLWNIPVLVMAAYVLRHGVSLFAKSVGVLLSSELLCNKIQRARFQTVHFTTAEYNVTCR